MPDAVTSQGATSQATTPNTTAPAQPGGFGLRLTLNSDGQRHPLLNALAVFTLVVGVAAFVLGLYHRQHVIPSVLGIVAFGAGLFGQLMSATREQRVLLVAGLVAGFVGMGLGIAHGGF